MTRVRAYRYEKTGTLIGSYVGGIMMKGDALADTLEIDVRDGGYESDVSDYTVGGYLIRADGVRVPLTGTIDKNIVRVPLSEHCYAIGGGFVAFVRLIKGGERVTILRVSGYVETDGDGPLLDPENIIPSLEELLAQLDELERATAAAQDAAAKIDGMTVSATSSSTAGAAISERNGVKHISFALPRGEAGPAGTAGVSPTVSVSAITGGHRVTITDANGTKTFDVLDGTGSGDGGLPWLIGTTEEITPTQVQEALTLKRNVMISYANADVGTIAFTNFTVLTDFGAVFASLTGALNPGYPICFALFGVLASNEWNVSMEFLASADAIPRALPNPYGLYFRDSAGSIVAFHDGSIATDVTIPDKLPNPNALTFAGAATGSYDGSSAVEITIPEVAGKDGYTPVKGVDYWTDADQESVVQQVIAALGTPVYGWVDDDNTIILNGNLTSDTYTIMYEDAEGNLTYIGTINGGDTVSFINRLREATDANGSIYNGKGWKENVRISVSGGFTETAHDGTMLTGFIPVRAGDIIRLKNVAMPPTTSDYKSAAYSFDSNKTGITNTNITSDTGDTFGVVIEDGNVVQFTVSAHFFGGDASGSGYLRINAERFTNSSIITVNQEIT